MTHKVCANYSMQLTQFHLEEWEKVDLEDTMANIHLMHSAMRSLLLRETYFQIFGLGFLLGIVRS